MLEYAVVAGGLLSSNLDSLFNFDSIRGVALIGISGVVLIVLGGLMKGFWGAVITFSIGSFLFRYFKGLLPIG
jgi:hypothetical protein